MSIPPSARRHRPSEMDGNDTSRRVNYRPTALPRTHHRNMSPYRSAGARWLSEDEGVDTAKKVDRYSDEDVAGSGRNKHLVASASPSTKQQDSSAANRSQQSHSSPSQSHTQEATIPETSSGSPTVGRSRVPSAGLMAAKAQWKAMENIGRRRLRRANSQEQVPEPSSREEESESSAPISGHPIAPDDGVPMPSIRAIAPMRRRTGGVRLYQSNVAASAEAPAAPSATVDVDSSSNSRPPSVVDSQSGNTAGSTPNIPDYASGRGGDGIGGHGAPSEFPASNEDEEQAKVDLKRKLLPELKSILTW